MNIGKDEVMRINLNVKIKAGPRTPVEVGVYGTSVNEKVISFANGNQISESKIAEWLEENLTRSLKAIQEERK